VNGGSTLFRICGAPHGNFLLVTWQNTVPKTGLPALGNRALTLGNRALTLGNRALTKIA
jgi:hypothetical protein